MNRKNIISALILLTLMTFSLAAQGNSGTTGFTGGIETALQSVAKAPLSDAEKQGILLMREEEKLARDVYTALYEKWNLRVFTNISKAEQTHMDAMKLLVDRYGLSDPMTTNEAGVFTNPELQKLYNDLVAQGSTSLENAVKIGSTIEDLDIYDLERLMKTADNDDILIVYQNLLKGSRNHLRAFDRQLQRNESSYTAQYLTQQAYDRIARSSQERGTVITDPRFTF